MHSSKRKTPNSTLPKHRRLETWNVVIFLTKAYVLKNAASSNWKVCLPSKKMYIERQWLCGWVFTMVIINYY